MLGLLSPSPADLANYHELVKATISGTVIIGMAVTSATFLHYFGKIGEDTGWCLLLLALFGMGCIAWDNRP